MTHRKRQPLPLRSTNHEYTERSVCEVFDIFRQDPWGHPDGPFANILRVHSMKPLDTWLIYTSTQMKLKTIRAFLRVYRKGITLSLIHI